MVSPPPLVAPHELDLNRLNMLVFGDFGQGKTTFAGTFPNCLFLSVEGGDIALREMPTTHQIDPRTRIHRIRTMDDMRQAYAWIASGAWGGFDSIVIDSLSDLQDKALYEVMARRESRNPNSPKGQPQQRDWQEVTITLRRMAMLFRDLPKNVVFTTLYRNDKNPQTVGGYAGSRPIRAELSPSVYKAVAAYVDIVGFLQQYPVIGPNGQPTGVTQRYMIFDDPTQTYAVKKRFVSLPSYIINPTYQSLIQAIGGNPQ